jgi:hypothetical protein
MQSARRELAWLALCAPLVVAAPASADTSTKPGVVEQCGSFLERAWRDVSGAVKNLFARSPRTYPNIAVIEDDGTLLERDDINLCGVAQVYYKNHADDRHMLFVFAQGDGKYAKGYNAYYSSLRNDVKGIGRALTDRSKSCGSNGKLLGFANMNGTSKWKMFLAPLLDLWPLGVIIHEIGHQWIAYVDAPVKGEKLTTDPASALRSHWQPLVHTDASIMYGNAWKQITPEVQAFGRRIPATFASVSLPKGFSPLDKYLMGIYPASKVKPFFVIDASSKKIHKHFALPGNTAAGKKVVITIEDVQAALGGPRDPDYRSAQKLFNAAFVLVVPKGAKAASSALEVVEYFRKRIPEKLKKETEGAFSMATTLAPK